MMTGLDESLSLRHAETTLASHEIFGDWRPIINRALTFYYRGIEALAEHLPAANSFLRAMRQATDERLYRVLGDPVVRFHIYHALERLKNGALLSPDEVEPVLDAAAPFFDEGVSVAPLQASNRPMPCIGTGHYQAWVWCDDRPEGLLRQQFRSLFEREIATKISTTPAVIRTPDDRMKQTLAEGCQLLFDLLPELAASVLAHVHLIVVVDVADRRQWAQPRRRDLSESLSNFLIPGTIFLSPTPLSTPWGVAEALLHEAAHKKIHDLAVTRAIFRDGYAAHTSPTVRSIWNRPLTWNPNEWAIDRALFAFHVYVHLGLFFKLIEGRVAELGPIYGPLSGLDPEAATRRSCDRARYLGHEVKQSAGAELTREGYDLNDWLLDILDAIDPAPPPSDLHARLLAPASA